MVTRLLRLLVVLAMLTPFGCGGNSGDSNPGQATLRGVVVDGNPYNSIPPSKVFVLYDKLFLCSTPY